MHMSWILILKLLIVAVFLVMFLRKPTLTWGVGLLCVTTAVLLDTLLGTFDTMALLAEMGFFFYVIAGVLVGRRSNRERRRFRLRRAYSGSIRQFPWAGV